LKAYAQKQNKPPTPSSTPLTKPRLQAKLRVNSPGDIHEQEADRVAEQVVNMPEPQLTRPLLGGPPNCHNDCQPLQTKSVQTNDVGTSDASPIVTEVTDSPGQSLDILTREFMEARFGHDFSRVRVHTDARAIESANRSKAWAYTVGQNIVFNKERYRPHLKEGRQLLAHELTHTLQQQGMISSRIGLTVNSIAGKTQAAAKQENRDTCVEVASHVSVPMLQRQSKVDDNPTAKTETESDRVSKLLKTFSNREMDPYIKSYDSMSFLMESRDKNAIVDTVRDVRKGEGKATWTYTFVTVSAGNTHCTYLKEAEDGKSIANYYQRCITTNVSPLMPWYVLTNNGVFMKGTGNFDVGSAFFFKLCQDFDALFKTHAPHTNLQSIVITVDGENNPINLQRANTIKEELVKMKVNKNRISIQFAGKVGSPLILMQNTQ
jgi:hypothetical protein